jgi:hypothetical protein
VVSVESAALLERLLRQDDLVLKRGHRSFGEHAMPTCSA